MVQFSFMLLCSGIANLKYRFECAEFVASYIVLTDQFITVSTKYCALLSCKIVSILKTPYKSKGLEATNTLACIQSAMKCQVPLFKV